MFDVQAVPGISKTQQEHIQSLFDKYVDGGLAWVRKQGKEYIPSVDNNLTTTLMLLLQVSTCVLCSWQYEHDACCMSAHSSLGWVQRSTTGASHGASPAQHMARAPCY
jgi:hypothetical protein